MPFGDFVNQIPAPIFLAIHLTAFLIGALFAWRSFSAEAPLLGWAFADVVIRPAESGTHTLATAGTHRYTCTFHPNDMNGSVLVTDL